MDLTVRIIQFGVEVTVSKAYHSIGVYVEVLDFTTICRLHICQNTTAAVSLSCVEILHFNCLLALADPDFLEW